jgi:hypothetical protein
MHELFQALKSRSGPDSAPTVLELEIIEGKRALDDPLVVQHFAHVPRSGADLGIPLPVRPLHFESVCFYTNLSILGSI